MKKVILTRGLPGSGKTFWAKQLQKEYPNQYERVNKDELRSMLHDGRWSRENEDMILRVRDAIILEALNRGKHVIVDDTNFAPRHEARIKQLVGSLATVEIKDFTDFPLEECIKRDLQRLNSVGEKVIRKMYNQYLKPKPPEVILDKTLPMAIIVDIDGTLALFGDANPYERDYSKDECNRTIARILLYYKDDYKILLVSGRKEKSREVTEAWLQQNGVAYDILWMRKTEDNRRDSIIKGEIYEANIRGKYCVDFILDDRRQMIDYWRSLGLVCLQVAEGDF